jgi:4-aminobutyrate aminotransferase
MLVADEIQTGFGRTGKTFAIEHSGVRPDLLVYAKGFANGMPISGIVSRKEVMASMPPGSLGGTYSGNVVACAAALATTTYMRTHDVLGNVNARSAQVFEGLRAIQADKANGGWMIEEVRGKGVSDGRFDSAFGRRAGGNSREEHRVDWGDIANAQLMVALEFKDPNSKLTSHHDQGPNVVLPPNLNKLVQDAAMERGLLTLTTSIYPVLRMIPALILSEAEVDEMLAIIAESVKAVAAQVEGRA